MISLRFSKNSLKDLNVYKGIISFCQRIIFEYNICFIFNKTIQNNKRNMKNSKFGFGGKKDKRNNADSHFGGNQGKRPGSAKKGGRPKQKRPGKNARAQAKKA